MTSSSGRWRLARERRRRGESLNGMSRLLMGRPVTSDLRPVGLTVPPSHCRRTPVWVMSMVALLSRMTGGLTLRLALPQNPWDWVRSSMD